MLLSYDKYCCFWMLYNPRSMKSRSNINWVRYLRENGMYSWLQSSMLFFLPLFSHTLSLVRRFAKYDLIVQICDPGHNVTKRRSSTGVELCRLKKLWRYQGLIKLLKSGVVDMAERSQSDSHKWWMERCAYCTVEGVRLGSGCTSPGRV